jgi:hypothetical protein
MQIQASAFDSPDAVAMVTALTKYTRSVEVVDSRQQLQRVYFRKPLLCDHLPADRKDKVPSRGCTVCCLLSVVCCLCVCCPCVCCLLSVACRLSSVVCCLLCTALTFWQCVYAYYPVIPFTLASCPLPSTWETSTARRHTPRPLVC